MRVPTPQELREELRPDTLHDVSEVADFDSRKLKHVETQEKNVLPTKEGNVFPIVLLLILLLVFLLVMFVRFCAERCSQLISVVCLKLHPIIFNYSLKRYT